MKIILIKTLLLFSIAAIILIPVAWKFNSGNMDPFYTRLTTDKAPSLIIGTSRAAQGLQPYAFKEYAPQMQNFSFTVAHSPFGPTYLELIKAKLDASTRNGLFIIAVDPWAVSSLSKQELNPEDFRENKLFTSKIHLVNMNPNYEYILRHYDAPLYHVFEQRSHTMKLHKDGWLQVNISIDSAIVRERIKSKMKDYQKYADNAFIHPLRLQTLEETIVFLNNYGAVFLVRLPVAREMADIEAIYAPNFDKTMQGIAKKHDIYYLNYIDTSGDYQTTDGNHLYKEASRAVSEKVALDIRHIIGIASFGGIRDY